MATRGNQSDLTDSFDQSWMAVPLPIESNDKVHGKLGPYDILGEIGRGGMGVVFKGFDRQLNRMVAIKVLAINLSALEVPRKRFLREGRAAAAISHPNVVTIYGVEEYETLPCLVMEYAPGQSLRHWIRQPQSHDVRWVIRVARQIAQGLSAAHQVGVIHRDIKPSNILLDEAGSHVKIVDFGIAYVDESEQITDTGLLVGTPAFMSPEQVQGKTVDARSDLFSLGCVLYSMFTGESPFKSSNPIATSRQVTDNTPPSLSTLNETVHPALSRIVDQLLEKQPEDRFQSAEELDAALAACEAALDAPGGTGKPIPFLTPREARGGRKKRAGVAGTTAIVALVTSLVALSVSLLIRAPAPKVEPNRLLAIPNKSAPRTLTVSRIGDGQFRSLNDALQAVQPGETIEITDSEEYAGPFVFSDPYRMEGVQLVSSQRPTLSASFAEGRLAVVNIGAVRNVTLRGLRIRSGLGIHALYLHDDVAGVTLEDLDLEQPSGSDWANVLISRDCHGIVDLPFTLRRCRLVSQHFGIFVGRDDIPNSIEAAHFVCEDCSFSGPATHVVVNHAVRNFRLERNTFTGGNGIWFQLNGQSTSGAISIRNNTFFRVGYWLGFGDDRADYDGVAVNNLILEAKNDYLSGKWTDRKAPWEIHHNGWERPTPITNVKDMIEFTPDAQVRSRVPESDDYLCPEGNGWSATRGGEPTQYLGAKPPRPASGFAAPSSRKE